MKRQPIIPLKRNLPRAGIVATSIAAARIVAAILFCVTAALNGNGQQASSSPTAPAGGSSPAIWITARNPDGTPAELSGSDLEVKIDGKRIATTEIRRANESLRYCLLLDTSGSQRQFLQTQHDEAVALLSKIPQPGRDYGLLVPFSDQAFLDAESSDPQKLIKAIRLDARGGTAMFDAMVACSGALSKGAPDAALHTMFIISDGEDNASKVTRTAVERALISSRVRVYAIAEKDADSSHSSRGIANLEYLAELTGGKSYLPGRKWTLDKILADIATDLAGLYAVTPNSDRALAADRFHKLEVKSTRKDVAISAPRQYFVPLQ